MTRRPISKYMSATPHTIGADQPLSVAHELMREHHVRHLPVLERGEVVGVLSQRDLYFIETLKGVVPEEVPVSEAMATEPYLVDREAPLEQVATAMAARKLGSAVVLAGGRVAGVFTTIDALHALAEILGAERTRARPARRAQAKERSTNEAAVRSTRARKR
jgi:acetoin utilization protein AcuB